MSGRRNAAVLAYCDRRLVLEDEEEYRERVAGYPDRRARLEAMQEHEDSYGDDNDEGRNGR